MTATPEKPAAAAAPAAPLESPWSPLRIPMFRMLWSVWLTANICMWMNDVAAAWMMTTLTASPVMVALVQSASSLPVFFLGLPSGALADILDRRKYFIFTQFWVATVGVLMCLVTLSGHMVAPLLLLLTFANGVGLAMRWPVFSAVIPEIIPKPRLPAAMALNGLAMNASRIIGPMLAGALIAAAGSAYVFALNAVLSVLCGIAIMRWKTEPKASALPAERFFGAIRVGLRYARESSPLRAILLRVAVFFVQAMGVASLLPLVARNLPGGGASTFTLLLGAMGSGAVVGAMLMPRIRARMAGDVLLRNANLLQAVSSVCVAFAPNVWVAVPAMFFNGLSLISAANSLAVSAQMSLPNWVRARGMSMYQMSLMGGGGIGAAIWGQVASFTSVRISLVAAAVCGVTMMTLVFRFSKRSDGNHDLTPSQEWTPPKMPPGVEGHEGPVLTTIEYLIDPAKADEFQAVMRETRSSRLRQGALSSEVFRDASVPGRYVEHMLDESWIEQLRRFGRVTAYDVDLRHRRMAFHIGDQAPRVTRSIAQALD